METMTNIWTVGEKMRKIIIVLLMVIVIGIPALSFAVLIDRGGGLIYDSDLNITWLQSANNVKRYTSKFNGVEDIFTFAAGFTYYDSVRNITWSDWRLPATSASPSGAAGELGHLYYTELGNSPGGPLVNRGPFENLASLATDWYWTGTLVPGTEGGMKEYYIFSFSNGSWNQDCGMPTMSYGNYVLLVRDGDVGPPPAYTFSLHFSGDGSGYVQNSATSEICNADCSSSIAGWTTVTLHVTGMDQYTVFGGWAGACTNISGDCVFTMDGAKGATATFNRDIANAVRIDIPTPGPYSSITAAYSNASSGAVIMAWGTWFEEMLNFSDVKTVSLRGGYNRDYSDNNGFSTLIGALTIGKGSVTVENLSIR